MGKTHILMLGSSFTTGNDLPSLLAGMTDAEVVPIAGVNTCLSDFLDPEVPAGAMAMDALTKGPWDYVVLQEAGIVPATAESYFIESAGRLCGIIRDTGAKPVIFATWAYLNGTRDTMSPGISYEEMNARLTDAYHKAAYLGNAILADVTKAFASHTDREALYEKDGRHPGPAGSMLAARTIAAVIMEDREKAGKKQKTQEEVRHAAAECERHSENRLRLIYLYNILLRHSDEAHPLTTGDILKRMEEDHGIKMHRTTVPSDIALLSDAGFPIQEHRGRSKRYFLEEGKFMLPELKLLIDAVESSRFITEKQSAALVSKLVSLTSEANAAALKRNLYTTGPVKSVNNKSYYIVDGINEAINKQKRIRFRYTDYDLQKRQVLRHNGTPYTVSPYALIWNGDYYYLVGYYHEKKRVNTFRVDRIFSQPEILRKAALPQPEGFDIRKFTREVFRMYDAQPRQKVTLLCENSMIRGLVDVFGIDFPVTVRDDGHFQTQVDVCASPTFFAWVFQWGDRVHITAPEGVCRSYIEHARLALGDAWPSGAYRPGQQCSHGMSV